MGGRRWWVLGSVLVVAGAVALVVQGDPRQADFGWFAYTPLGGGDLDPTGAIVFLTRTRLLGAAAVLVGLLVLAAAWGYRAGRRTTARNAG